MDFLQSFHFSSKQFRGIRRAYSDDATQQPEQQQIVITIYKAEQMYLTLRLHLHDRRPGLHRVPHVLQRRVPHGLGRRRRVFQRRRRRR